MAGMLRFLLLLASALAFYAQFPVYFGRGICNPPEIARNISNRGPRMLPEGDSRGPGGRVVNGEREEHVRSCASCQHYDFTML